MSTKIQLPWLRPDEQIGLGDAFKNVTNWLGIQAGPNCGCETRRLAWNQIITFTGIQTIQPQRPHKVPIERPPTDDQ